MVIRIAAVGEVLFCLLMVVLLFTKFSEREVNVLILSGLDGTEDPPERVGRP